MALPIEPSVVNLIEHFVLEHWATLLSLGGIVCGSIALVWYTLKQIIPDLIKRIELTDKLNKEVHDEIKENLVRLQQDQNDLDRRAQQLGYTKRNDLLDSKGETLFQLRDGCILMRDNCVLERSELKQSICKKIEEVKSQLNSDMKMVKDSIDHHSQDAQKQRERTNEVLFRVEKIMEKDLKAERREEMLEVIQSFSDKLSISIMDRIKRLP